MDDAIPNKSRELTIFEMLGFGVAGCTLPAADDIYEMLQELRKGIDPLVIPDDDAAEFTHYVRSTKHLSVSLIGAMAGMPVNWRKDGHRCMYSQIGAAMAVVRRLSNEEREAMKALPFHKQHRKLRLVSRWLSRTYGIVMQQLKKPAEATRKKDYAERLKRIQQKRAERLLRKYPRQSMLIVSAFRTVGLCWICYGKYPSQLLRQARNGDLRALEDVLRMDRRLIFDKRLQIKMRRELGNPKSAFARTALRAMKARPPAVSRRAMKARMAAFVKLTAVDSDLFTEGTIRGMYDNLKHNQNKSEIIDPTLPDDPGTWRKAVWREEKKVAAWASAAVGQK